MENSWFINKWYYSERDPNGKFSKEKGKIIRSYAEKEPELMDGSQYDAHKKR